MIKHLLVFLLLTLNAAHAFAQLNVTTGQTAQQLAEVIAGPGVVVSNASITGDASAIGAFTSGANNPGIGLPSGVVMASGDVTDIPQPNTAFASTVLGTPGNTYLGNQANTNSNDAIILEFDFVPNADFVSFNYVFGSEEYPEFICSAGGYNDIFAFTIEGVTVPMPQTNIALIPGTTVAVSVNNVNDDAGCGGDYSAFYIDNTSGPASQYCVYDGLTVVLTAETPVQCGETYTLRLMLSDGGDSAFDSGCFIEENSLTTGSVIVDLSTASSTSDTIVVEGCGDATVSLTLNGPPLSQDFPVPIWISESTADWGVDFDPIPEVNTADSTVIIPAGQNSTSFVISPINDNIPEGLEYIQFIAITSTCGDTDTFRIYIDDLNPIVPFTSNDTTICTGNAISWVNANGGGADYTFTWDDFGVADTVFPSPTETTTYSVTVTDNCGSEPAMDSVTVAVDDGPLASAGNDISTCIGGSVFLNASSDTPAVSYAWTPNTFLSDTSISNPISTPDYDLDYVVTVTRTDGCSNSDTVNVSLTPPPDAPFDLPAQGCANQPMIVSYEGNATASGQFQWDFDGGTVTNGSGIGPYAVYWDTPGTYNVTLQVAWNGCVSEVDTNQVEILGPPPVDAGTDVTFCSGDTVAIGSPGLSDVTYLWTPSNGVADPNASLSELSLSIPAGQPQTLEYILRAQFQGCKNYDTIMVNVLPKPTAEFIIPEGKCFNTNNFDLEAGGFFSDSATFSWDFGPVGFPSSSTDQNIDGLIFNAAGSQEVELIIEDNGCISEPFIGTIQVFEMPRAGFTATPLEGCEPLGVQFTDTSYAANSTLYRTWSLGNGVSTNEETPATTYSAGIYDVRLDVTTAQGCADSRVKNALIEAFPKPEARFSTDPEVLDILHPVTTVANMTGDAVSSEFTFEPFGDQITAMETQYEFPDTGRFNITQIVTTENGCLDTTSYEVLVRPHFTLYIPNAFTPDNNGINEIWMPQGESIKLFEMTIFNRWNQELYYTSNIEEGWDGTFNGSPVQQGVYVYHIQVVDLLGESHDYKGQFSLIR